MAIAATNSYNGKGIAESFEDVIFDISPEDTPFLSAAKRMTAGQTYHQWQTDALAAAAANAQLEGLDSTYATLAATTVLGNYTQISAKTVKISGTYDVVKKYGRKSEVAYQLMKAGKELKRDMEYALVRNQASSAGGIATARTSAGIESWIVNRVLATGSAAGTTPGFASGTVAAPTDGTASTFVEADLKSALQAAWTDGGEPTLILMSALNKARFGAFAGIATKYNNVQGTSQAVITGAADIYVSDFGNHTVKLDRFMRDKCVLAIDPNYIGVATLRPMAKQELAKTGDSQNWLLTTEYALVVQNPDAHAKVQNTDAA
jgi:hypothetical protein